MSRKKIIVGTRGSKLALIQAEEVINALKQVSNEYTFEIKTIKTHGDKFKELPIYQLGKKGIFVKEIDIALLNEEIDISVHSMKDLPSEVHEKICIAAVPKRKSCKDVIYSRENQPLSNLKPNSIIGTSSFRRQSQILFLRKDLKIRDIRGNFETRIKKVDNGEYDAIVIANVGVERLNLNIKVFDLPEYILPAAGQGALAVECLSENEEMKVLLKKINHNVSYLETKAEMSFIKHVGGGCRVPIGVLGTIERGTLHLSAEILDLQGEEHILTNVYGIPAECEEIAKRLTKHVYNLGGYQLLNKINEQLNRRNII